MDKKVMLAVAGAGKTYHICHSINPNERNLILAYTHENIYNIQKELCDAYGNVPSLTTVMTFDAFVYQNIILPYEPSIGEYFGITDFVSKGICTITPPSHTIKSHGKSIPNHKYISKDKIRHYITNRKQYYCDNISELALQVKKGRESLIKRAAMRLNRFYDYVLIDEFQDFREHDYDLIIQLSKALNKVLLVGDYYQHSVSAKNNTGKPFEKKKQIISYNDFIANLIQLGFEVDTTTLSKSRRCSPEVCSYVSEKLGIDITSNNDHTGSVIWVTENAKDILDDKKIVKLVFKNSSCYKFSALNWSYSKGDTVKSACVILTDKLDDFDNDVFSAKKLPPSTLNKLYVAMTRSKGDLYLMKFSIFKPLQNEYRKDM